MAERSVRERRALWCALAGLALLVVAVALTRVEIPRFDHDVPAADVGDSPCPSVAEEWGTPRSVWDATCQARFTQAELVTLGLGTAGVVLLLAGAALLMPRLWQWTSQADAAEQRGADPRGPRRDQAADA